ncbi:hypothetical protein HTZ77_14420 [Nonomuraea sp. SMC257]|uniref:FtsX extracellular domain-containing protein n=1 Tax=Nonomuraea montanisoli TaxID=2741721 RepID=A0A7Y6I7J8_9ACTN|nr:permease-like cell division protein FtsX [Nonomuraea montanisoli]NUW32618.1 hypothetical protein [Nonomuraea montanisoli]
MNSPVEDRLREALGEVGATVEVGALRPLMVPDRRRFGVNMRLGLVGAAAVVVAGAATVVGVMGVTGSGADDGATMAASQPQAPAQADLSVFLCTGREPDNKVCQGRAATEEQKAALAESLPRIPGVASVHFEDRRAAHERFRAAFADSPDVLGDVKEDELPESYRITVDRGSDPKAVAVVAQKMPGVALAANVTMVGLGPAGLKNREDIAAFLCNASSVGPACDRYAARKTSKRGKAVTVDDRKSLEKQIRAMPEVRKVDFQSRAEAYANFKKLYSGNKALVSAAKVADMPESFRIFLGPGVDSAKVASELRARPGVSQVIEMRCVALKATLLADHGVERTNVCS